MASGSYLALAMGDGLGGGIVECAARRPLWLPYVEVQDVNEATDRARSSAPPSCSSRAKARRVARGRRGAGRRRGCLLAAEAR